MALTADRWFTVYKLTETSGKSTLLRVEQSAPADDTAARASAAALATDLQAVTDCVIESYYTYQEFVEDAFSLPSAAEVQNRAILLFDIEDAPLKTARVRIPGPKASIFAGATGPNYDIVDVTDSDVLAFVANFTSEALFYVSDGEQADNFLGGHRSHVAKSTS